MCKKIQGLENGFSNLWTVSDIKRQVALSYSNVARLRAFLAGFNFEGYVLAFNQRTTAFHVDGGEVNEHIVAGFAGNESITLFIIEPLNRTGFDLV
jgi:hypothetical protein